MITAPRPPSVRSMGTDFGDPLNALLRPPAGESESEKQLRLQREEEAKRISDSIDEELRQEERRFRKRKEDVKVSDCTPLVSCRHIAVRILCIGRPIRLLKSLPLRSLSI